MKQSYINLAIVDTKEQQVKEKKLLNVQYTNEILSTYEEIYGAKIKIDIKNIFDKCADQKKNTLVLGRAGIGKTTFCRYVAYQWATGELWQEYELLVLIPLRNLTKSRYPVLKTGARYSLIDLIKTEYHCPNLSHNDETILKEQLDNNKVLWLLDGYDEIIVQNIPSHLEYLLEQLLKTPHHILTTRPYLNTLSYNVQLEIIGFTDDNIKDYIKQFFEQIQYETDNDAPSQSQKLLRFLKCNPKIWGIVHIPINLELICSLWCDIDWSETTMLTMTSMYDTMIEWLCRKYLRKQKNISSDQMTKETVYAHCSKELAFLESLAFHGMKKQSIILPPELLKLACKESRCSLKKQSHLLNMGILKSFGYKPIGTRIEMNKDHYFLHLSLQENFAARYLVDCLLKCGEKKKNAMNFIKSQKYNPRFELVLTFTCGILSSLNDNQSMKLFWEILLEEPLDLIGFRHVQIIICCLEETRCDTNILQYDKLIQLIIRWIHYSVYTGQDYSDQILLASLQKSPYLVNQFEILKTFETLCENKDSGIKESVFWFISRLPIYNPSLNMIQLHLEALKDQNSRVQESVCYSLGNIGEKAATDEIINRILILLAHTNQKVRRSAYLALERMGGEKATDRFLDKILSLLGHTNYEVRLNAYFVLRQMNETTKANQVVIRLLNLLTHPNDDVRIMACETLRGMGEKLATDESINTLVGLLSDTNCEVRSSAYDTLRKIGGKAANNELIERLLSLFDHPNYEIRSSACYAFGRMGKKAATSKVINRLLMLCDDTNPYVKISTCYTIGRIGEKVALNSVIDRLLILSNDANSHVRSSACDALGRMGKEASTSLVINRLWSLCDDSHEYVRISACCALGRLSKKVATNQVINAIVTIFDNKDKDMICSACDILKSMGEKAATKQIIERLPTLLADSDEYVRRSACNLLITIGEKAANYEAINKLISLLDNTNEDVIWRVCEIFKSMGEKAAHNEVIYKLLLVLSNTMQEIRNSAYDALGSMGEKAVCNQVIETLIDVDRSLDFSATEIQQSSRKICDLLSDITILKDDRVQQLSKCYEQSKYEFQQRISPGKMIKTFLSTEIYSWLPVIGKFFTNHGYGISINEHSILIYSNKEPMELLFSNKELACKTKDYFNNWLDKLLQAQNQNLE